ncbi:MAG: GNAT family N-acetyltransferase [Oscillospiraceae bacterium]|nr:GNAT family N-acetyltransferase [Oscillospiraceae bacterium]
MRTLKKLTKENTEDIITLFRSVFTAEPWKDDWSDENQLRMYINDLTGNENSLTYGLFDEGELVGLSMGYVMHWYMATEYYIFELCIRTDRQGEGLGTYFLDEMEKELLAHDIKQIYLQTEENVPAYEFYKKRGFFVLNGHRSLGKNIDG